MFSESGVFSKGAPLPIQNDIRCANPFMRYARRFLRSRAGNVSALTAILILPLAALLGMATEGGSWFLITRHAERGGLRGGCSGNKWW
jgi:hypothetical protein